MLTEPLPTSLDVRRAAAREVTVSGAIKPSELPRFCEILADDAGAIEASLRFFRDEQERYLVRVEVAAEVTVTCQRCLRPKREELRSDSTLCIVWTDEQAAVVPRHLEPMIAAEQSCELRGMVEEELMLALPAFSYHDSDACRQVTQVYSEPPPAAVEGATGNPNPFEMLAQLKPGEKHQER